LIEHRSRDTADPRLAGAGRDVEQVRVNGELRSADLELGVVLAGILLRREPLASLAPRRDSDAGRGQHPDHHGDRNCRYLTEPWVLTRRAGAERIGKVVPPEQRGTDPIHDVDGRVDTDRRAQRGVFGDAEQLRQARAGQVFDGLLIIVAGT
jgi:hypothetical protein